MLDYLPAEIYELSGITIAFRVVLAMFVGGLIGTERDIKNRAAGYSNAYACLFRSCCCHDDQPICR